MRGSKTAQPMALTMEEVQSLQQLIYAPDTPLIPVMRAQIILAAHAHPEQSDRLIATTVCTTAATIHTWADDG
jgi:hypothetical protein